MKPEKPAISIVWFKRDLRLFDNAPLNAAVSRGNAVLPLFIIEPDLWSLPTSSQRHWQFARDCLCDLQEACNEWGQPLIIRIGAAIDIFEGLRSQMKIESILCHQETGLDWTYRRDRTIATWCHQNQIHFIETPTNGVVRGLRNRDDWAGIRKQRLAKTQLPIPTLPAKRIDIISDGIPDNEDPLFGPVVKGKIQQGGRRHVSDILVDFATKRSPKYISFLSSPIFAETASSRLSAHLAWGTVSTREVVHTIRTFSKSVPQSERRGCRAMLTRLGWRCHFIQKLEDQPNIEFKTMHPYFDDIRTTFHDEFYLEAWMEGRTGYPLIDACMRCLQKTGWIPFRMRAMLVSFASYQLWLDWRQTAPHLARLFTDFEPGIHYSQFQMQSGVTGINTIRIYNPVKQSHDHDKQGNFIRKWIEELQNVPEQWIHEPHLLTHHLKARYGCLAYPEPLVDNKTSISHARARLAEALNQDNFAHHANQVYQKLGSRNPPRARKKPQPKTKQLSLF